ncbi:hypothetical protein JW992_11045 [candidate division KSB1 bacterium]|nr:hypothetical protein [candidate division KSB1 bacterium]
MPDLITHTFAAYLLVRWWQHPAHRAVFYLGTLLPDLISRPIYILFPQLMPFTYGLHTPLFVFLFCLLVAEFFARDRSKIRVLLCSGAALHFFLDMLQRHIGMGYLWGFPLTWKSFEIGWFWPETPMRWVPVWLTTIVFCEIGLAVFHYRRRLGKQKQAI